jgi:hypothetical protein
MLRHVGDIAPKVYRDTLKRLSFDCRDAIQDDVARALDYSGASTRNFISKFRVRYTSNSESFSSAIYPAGERSKSLLARHVEQYNQTTRDRADLIFDGRIAIPIDSAVKRSSTGKVRANMLPHALVDRDARGKTQGFVSGNVIFRRLKRGNRPAFVLRQQTTNPQRIDVHATFDRTIRTRAPIALAKAMSRTFTDASRRAVGRALSRFGFGK